MKKESTGFKLNKFNCQQYLTNYKNDADFINAHLIDDDPRQMVFALSVLARAKGMSVLSKSTGISRDGLYKALTDEGNPSIKTVMRIMRGLDLRLSVRVNKSG
jgi:probable addiction module antidote protein